MFDSLILRVNLLNYMNILGFIQTKERRIYDLVDWLKYVPSEQHAKQCDIDYPGQYVRVVDRGYGAEGLLHVDDIRLLFRIK